MKKGFTLVELAIVLVIIGLIVGGVLVGQDLIKTAELRSLLSDVEKYQAAINTFRNKYNGLPGDMRNATDFWGAADPDPDDCGAAITGMGATCNGNGDGRVNGDGEQEMFLFWQHLANANLINHSFRGVASATDMLPINNAFSFYYITAYVGTVDAGDTNMFAGQYGHAMTGYDAPADIFASMLPADIRWLDTKKDDGLPGTGQFRSVKNTSPDFTTPCTTTDDPATSEYDLSNTASKCQFFIMNAY